MAASFWTGSINFGLVHIPVSLVTAEEPHEISFHLLDSRDQSRIGFKRYNKETGKEVDWDDIVKGYEYEEGKYVTFSDDDFKAIAAEANKSLDIQGFVDKEEISPLYFSTPYLMAPAKGGEKGYLLLEKILEKKKKLALVQVVIRTKEHLAVIIPQNGALVLNILRYEDELKDPNEVLTGAIKKVKVTERESKMAEQLLESMTMEFKPEKYDDGYLEKLQAVIAQKIRSPKNKKKGVKGKTTVATHKVIDIADLLAQSMKKKSGTKTPHRKRA